MTDLGLMTTNRYLYLAQVLAMPPEQGSITYKNLSTTGGTKCVS